MAIKSFRGEKVKIEHIRETRDGPVTTVIDTAKDGSKDIYTRKNGVLGSYDYGHVGYDKKGVKDNDRAEGKKRKGKFYGYALEYLSELSFSELQIIEAKTTNQYIRQSARHFMQRAVTI